MAGSPSAAAIEVCGKSQALSAPLDAIGNLDHNSATVPVTNGTATLVPRSVREGPIALKLVMLYPGAIRPRLPIELPKFEQAIGLPRRSQATTGTTQG